LLATPEISEWKKHSAKRVALNSLGFKHASMFSWSLDIPSGYVKIAMENGHRNSEFSHEKW